MNVFAQFFHTRLEAMAGLTEEMKQLPETENWRRDAKRGASYWVGKMCCKAPGGKYRKSISKSRFRFEFRKVQTSNAKSRKVKRRLCEFRKVEK